VNVDYEPNTTDVRQDFVSLGTRLTQERRGELFDRWYIAARQDARAGVLDWIEAQDFHHADLAVDRAREHFAILASADSNPGGDRG